VTKNIYHFDPQPKPGSTDGDVVVAHVIYICFCKRLPVHKIGYSKGTSLKVTLPLYKHLLVGVAHQCETFLSHTH